MNEQPERRLERLAEATDEKMKAGATDVAVVHHLADLRGKMEVAPELNDKISERLSTNWLPIEKDTIAGLSPVR